MLTVQPLCDPATTPLRPRCDPSAAPLRPRCTPLDPIVTPLQPLCNPSVTRLRPAKASALPFLAYWPILETAKEGCHFSAAEPPSGLPFPPGLSPFCLDVLGVFQDPALQMQTIGQVVVCLLVAKCLVTRFYIMIPQAKY